MLLFVGWVPPAIAALVTGVILIVFAEGDGDSLLAGIMAGTIVGYVAGLTFHFALGVRLQRRGASPWTADGFLLLSTVVGVVAGVAMAVLGWIDNSLVLIPIVLTIGFVIVAIVAATRGD